jgi:predicted dehydrogenase
MTLNIGFVGTGIVSALHARAISRTPGLALCGVTDLDSGASSARGREWGTTVYPDLKALLADDDVDAVWVLTPMAAHVTVATAAVKAGKHVLVEKPVSEDEQSITDLAQLATAAGVIALPAHNYLHLPEARRLVHQVRQGELGRIRALTVNYAVFHPEALASRYGSVLAQQMVHHTYLALAVLGCPTRVYAGAAHPAWTALANDDQAWMTWEYEAPDAPGTTAHLFASYAVDDLGSSPQSFAVKVLGENGTAEFNWRASTRRAARPGGYTVDLPLYEETYEHEVAAFRDVVAGVSEPISDLHDAALAARILSSAHAAASTHTAIDIAPPSSAGGRSEPMEMVGSQR